MFLQTSYYILLIFQVEHMSPILFQHFLVAEQLYIWSCLSICSYVRLSVRLSFRLSQIYVPDF